MPVLLALLGGSAGLAVRLMRPVALGWLCAVAAFAVLIGTTASSSAQDATGSQAIVQAIGRLGGHGSLVADDLGLTFLILAADDISVVAQPPLLPYVTDKQGGGPSWQGTKGSFSARRCGR